MNLCRLTILLETDNVEETVTFYTDLLGFTCHSFFPAEGPRTWVDLRRDDISIMFSARNAHSTVKTPTMTGSLYFNTDDVDGAWERLNGKVVVEYPIENFDYRMREFAVRDCNGYLIQFGQELPQD
ncbi:MAG TPA: VOC family protein [Blastocatellia bacterium]|nr:VOC family protein [Blastocatellia bacterium]